MVLEGKWVQSRFVMSWYEIVTGGRTKWKRYLRELRRCIFMSSIFITVRLELRSFIVRGI